MVNSCGKNVVIGRDVLVANVFIIDYNHGLNPLTMSYLENPLISGDICRRWCLDWE